MNRKGGKCKITSTWNLQVGSVRGVYVANVCELLAAEGANRGDAGGGDERRVGRISEQHIQLLREQPRLAGTADEGL